MNFPEEILHLFGGVEDVDALRVGVVPDAEVPRDGLGEFTER